MLYDKPMPRVFIADSLDTERFALHLLLMDLNLEVVGEAADWFTTLAQAPHRRTDMLLMEWNLLPNPVNVALEKAREACPAALLVVIVSHMDDCQRAAVLSSGADACICKSETLDRLMEGLRAAVARLQPDRQKRFEEQTHRRAILETGSC